MWESCFYNAIYTTQLKTVNKSRYIIGESTCSKLLEKANRFFEQKKEQDQNNSTVSNRPSQPATPTVQASSNG